MSARRPRTVRAVGPEEADAALASVADRLRAARVAIAALESMENARIDDLDADDDHLRRMLRSIAAKRRRLRAAAASSS